MFPKGEFSSMFKKRLLPLLFSLVFISGCTPLLNPDIASQSMPQEQVKEDIDKVLADEEPITEASTEATTEEAAGDTRAATSASTSENQDAAATTASSTSSANAVHHIVQAQNAASEAPASTENTVPHFVQAQNAASEKNAQNNAASTPASTQNYSGLVFIIPPTANALTSAPITLLFILHFHNIYILMSLSSSTSTTL